MHDTHRKAAEQHELAARAHRMPPNIMKKGTTKQDAGMRNGRWSIPIVPIDSAKEAHSKSGQIVRL